MKKILFVLSFAILSINGFSQTCEQRESKLLEAVGSFSAAALYNTYGTIGSIADGFGSDVYTAESVNSLIGAQKNLIDNLVKVFEELKSEKTITSTSDMEYATSSINIMKGLKKQADMVLDYVKMKTQAKLDAYEMQRKKNWKDLSKLMGIEE